MKRALPISGRLAADEERCSSVLGEDGQVTTMPSLLISTFNGHLPSLYALVERPEVDAVARGETLLVLAYLARTRRIPERVLYDYLAALPAHLQAQPHDFVWFGWVRAVAAMGFAGLSARAEQLFQRDLVDPKLIDSAGFWADLRESQDDPAGMSGRAWDAAGPIDNAIAWIGADCMADGSPAVAPVSNPLRDIGRNDPCPCGSGRKYKKCCLPA